MTEHLCNRRATHRVYWPGKAEPLIQCEQHANALRRVSLALGSPLAVEPISRGRAPESCTQILGYDEYHERIVEELVAQSSEEMRTLWSTASYEDEFRAGESIEDVVEANIDAARRSA